MVGTWGIVDIGFGIGRGGWYTNLMFNGMTTMNIGFIIGNVAIQMRWIEIYAG